MSNQTTNEEEIRTQENERSERKKSHVVPMFVSSLRWKNTLSILSVKKEVISSRKKIGKTESIPALIQRKNLLRLASFSSI
jgi:hypothetical protein